MMKTGLNRPFGILAVATCIAALTFFTATSANAAGATQEGLLYEWDGDLLSNPIGKVIWVQSAGKNKVNVTFVIQNALPNTYYSLGFDNYGANVDLFDDAPTTFGQLSESYHDCYFGPYEAPACAAVFFATQGVETDADGDASFHINIKNIDAQTASIVFWASVGQGTASPVAATDGFGGSDDLQFLSVVIP